MTSLPFSGARWTRAGAIFLAAVAAAVLCAGSARAGAPKPAWEIVSLPGPTHLVPGDHTGTEVFAVTATNIGGATAQGPIILTDRLPAPAVTLDPTGGFFGGLHWQDVLQIEEEQGQETCDVGPPQSCEDPNSLAPGESVTFYVPVDVAADAPETVVNEVSVSGGGTSASKRESTIVSATPAGFGLAPGAAGFSGAITSTDGAPATQAGSHPYELRTSLSLSTVPPEGSLFPAGNLRDLTVNLPRGVVVDPTATPVKCAEAELEARGGVAQCPDSSAVGLVEVSIGIAGVPTTEIVPLYNMVPPAGVPADLGFDFFGYYIHIFGGIRTGGDYGLSATARDILPRAGVIAVTATLWGDPSDPSHDTTRGECAARIQEGRSCPVTPTSTPLLTMPSACSGPLLTSTTLDSWQEPGSFTPLDIFESSDFSGNPVGVGGCEKLGFNPSIDVRPSADTAGAPSGLGVDVRLPHEESQGGLAEANLKKTVVTLPAGMTLSPSAANGLTACTPEQIGLDNAVKPSCPDSSKVGLVQATTPLLAAPLQGSVYVAQQGNNPFGSLLALYVVLEGSGVLIKLPGEVRLNPPTGQITTTFDDIPQQPVSDIKLSFFGGPRAPLVTPSACGTYTADALLAPWSSATPAVRASGFAVDRGCASPRPFAPSFSAGTTSNQAGAFSPFTVTFSRTDQDQNLGGASITTPPGLLAILRGVERCPEPQAAQGTCAAGSLIGHGTATAGVGADPVVVQGGKVFLTGPYKGAPFGLSIVVPAVAGPFNLGDVVVRAAINVDPRTSRITISSDPLPTILQGVPLDLKTVSATIDRPGFIFNPTNCEPLSVAGTFTSTTGATASVSSRFQAANCADLTFKPSFKVSTQAKTSKANGASLDVKVTSGAGQANIGKVTVSLPKQLPSRLTTIQQACPAATFDANPASCPAGSDIGIATASTPVLATLVRGPAYLVSHGGAAFPDLVVILQDEGVTVDLVGSINIKGGVTSSTFASVPDIPIGKFELSLPEGGHSALAANLPAKARGSLCGQKLTMPTTLTGQNGAQVKQATKIAVAGCPRAKKARKAKKAKRAKQRAARRAAIHSNKKGGGRQ
jgi:hypothetical protein